MNKRFIIIDGNAIVHRAYHALPPMTVKGSMVNAVYGFSSMLLKVINDLKPDYLAVSFDVAGGTFRHEQYKEYKATRVKADQELYDQIPLCYEIVKAFNIPIYTKKGYEADDVIATITTLCHPESTAVGEGSLSRATTDALKRDPSSCDGLGITTVVVTGDMDLLQLIDDETEVFAMRKGMSDTVLYNAEEVTKKYGFGPEYVVDYKALRGDTSDNIPGVPGIGEKTATELIQKIGSVEKIYQELENKNSELYKKFSPGIIKKLEAGKENAKMSYELATIHRDVPDLDFKLDDCTSHEFDTEKISDIFKKFEFWSLLKRLPGDKTLSLRGSANEALTKQSPTKQKTEITEITEKNFNEFTKDLMAQKYFACKEILSGQNILDSELLGFIFVTENNVYHLPIVETQNFASLRQIFTNKNFTLVGHDLKQLIKTLKCHAEFISASPKILKRVQDDNYCKNLLFDTMIASYIINSSTRSHDLKTIVQRELGRELSDASDQTSLFGANKDLIAEELQACLELYPKMQQKLTEIDDQGLFEKIEMNLIPVLAEMELNGVKVDTKKLAGLSVQVAEELKKITKKIWQEAGEEFNVASSQQLREILFNKLQLPTQGIKKGKTGLSTAESELEKLLEEHPIVPMILEHRELAKLQSTYVDVLPTLINKKTGRIHTTFNQAVTTTGRLSSSDPNLQNIPIRTKLGHEVREAFIAEPGYSLIVADYSQIELRIVASLANDQKMIEIFNNHEDIHQATAAVINGVLLEKVTKEMRQAAKEVNFGVLYGMGAYGLASRTGISNYEAKDFIQKYFENFSDVKNYLDQTLKLAKQTGYVETLFGRRRYVPELQAENFQLKNAGERMAINMPIQGTAADLMKLAMISVHENIKALKHKNNDDIKIIIQVHDELVLEVKNGLEDEVSKIVKEAMEGVVKLRVPVEVHISIGKRWGELK
ncbi:MAG: polymerase protein [Candidatus Magasanikbacteria bacterium GW2011_GWC2_37_14]|uniref:DNA polymerase I n=1 Tax=Candidatus Magasanikbacteria bacterium GW2011_GWC2_37_14 TaxID=1619046 RepID=A0A0G0IRU4_9BACT|nr:MAG: polymerase protein [Candidatus Magasanikbacteria bacterium GW2011_GWC2_37_14]